MRLFVDGCIEAELQRTWNPRSSAGDVAIGAVGLVEKIHNEDI